MNEKAFVFTDFLSASKPVNHQGVTFEIEKRASSALIFPIHGKLEFSWGSEVVYADYGHPVFIYEGMSYTNSCIVDAQSIMFNVKVQNSKEKMIPLIQPDIDYLQKIYEEIVVLNANPTSRNHFTKVN